MSSRRRPSHPTTPKWSTLTRPAKQGAETSVSKVFAKPQQGSRLRSAIDQLPAAVLDDAASMISETSRKREHQLSISSSMEDGDAESDADKQARVAVESLAEETVRSSPVSGTDEDTANSPKLIHPQAAIDVSTSSGPPLDTTPAPTTPTASAVRSPPIPFPQPAIVQDSFSSAPRSSWLGSWSRAKALERFLKSEDGAAESKSQLSKAASYSHSELTIRVQPGSPTGPEEGLSDLAARGRAGSAPPRPGSQEPQVLAAPAQGDSLTSISSIDDEVPLPRLVVPDSQSPHPAPTVVRNDEGMACERKPSVSSLNPSTSRFSLRLPLLGKSTLSSSSGVESATSLSSKDADKGDVTDVMHSGEPPRGASSGASSFLASNESRTPTQASEGQPPADALNTTAHVTEPTEPSSEKTNAPQGDTLRTDDANGLTPSTWWDYVPGWGSRRSEESYPTEAQLSGAGGAVDGGAEVSLPSAASQPSSAQPTPPSPESATPRATQNACSPVSAPVPLERQGSNETPKGREAQSTSERKPSSLFSADTAKSHGSVWYSPWAWYASSPKSSLENATAAASPPGDEIEQPTKTESEMVKERALAREETLSASMPEREPETAKPEPIPTAEAKIPIESTAETHRSGWMSFFVSRAMASKAITGESSERDENGMEVMHLDEDETPQQTTPVIAVPAEKQMPTDKQIPVPERQHSPAPSTNSGSVPSKREPKKPNGLVSTPPTTSDSIKREVRQTVARSPSPAPSKASGVSSPTAPRPPPPNLILPTWEDSFHCPPRSYVAPPPQKTQKTKLSKTLSYVSGVLFHKDEVAQGSGKGKEKAPEPEFLQYGQDLPKALDVLGEQLHPYILNGGCRVVVIGVAGWMPGPVTRAVAGGLPSSSSKFVNMTVQALEQFEQEHGFKFKQITKIPLEGDGTIERKVAKVHDHLLSDEDWMEDLHAADVIIVATHSQGSIISTHLVDRLIADGHILTSRSVDTLRKAATAIASGTKPVIPPTQAQKVCFLALCGIHLGPLRYLRTSSLLQPYIQYFENAAAGELFEFQNTESQLSKNYIAALKNVVDHGAKMVYVASLNDQVVPIYSGLFTAASHPRILRALYIDGDAYHSSDFLSNLLVLLIRIKNAGLSDSGLLAHLSEATAGTLSGVGHSNAYGEPATFSLAVKYFFLTNDGDCNDKELVIDSFNAVNEQNDYEIPWALRDVIADERVARLFAREFAQLRDAFDDWQPRTTILREVKRKLQPIQRLSSLSGSSSNGLASGSLSKL
ncbi:hypothetical protein OBBRIDRAFT_890611 [Obba rivulosa]|uniref:YMC020W-like alpha/beta hydrolase domain-containing protein n=1 Tax=Obba rivulosa TaxID=1052685 RepID=A0A8E2AL95_9APHY|nr:hypothetical protein OBBRIDRAFT_890611 [Obba rivulosa]